MLVTYIDPSSGAGATPTTTLVSVLYHGPQKRSEVASITSLRTLSFQTDVRAVIKKHMESVREHKTYPHWVIIEDTYGGAMMSSVLKSMVEDCWGGGGGTIRFGGTQLTRHSVTEACKLLTSVKLGDLFAWSSLIASGMRSEILGQLEQLKRAALNGSVVPRLPGDLARTLVLIVYLMQEKQLVESL